MNQRPIVRRHLRDALAAHRLGRPRGRRDPGDAARGRGIGGADGPQTAGAGAAGEVQRSDVDRCGIGGPGKICRRRARDTCGGLMVVRAGNGARKGKRFGRLVLERRGEAARGGSRLAAFGRLELGRCEHGSCFGGLVERVSTFGLPMLAMYAQAAVSLASRRASGVVGFIVLEVEEMRMGLVAW